MDANDLLDAGELNHLAAARSSDAQSRDKAATKRPVRECAETDRDNLLLGHPGSAQANDEALQPSVREITFTVKH